MLTGDDLRRLRLVRRGFILEYLTLAWNVTGIVVLAIAAITARSVALAGFGLDSLIEIGASTVVIWELSGTGEERQRRGLRLIGYAFAALALYLLVQSTVVLATGYHPRRSPLGIAWTALTAAAMFALAASKARTGRALDNPVLRTEGRVTTIDGILALAVLLGLTLNAAGGWWWADPAAGYVLVYYATREVREAGLAVRANRHCPTSHAHGRVHRPLEGPLGARDADHLVGDRDLDPLGNRDGEPTDPGHRPLPDEAQHLAPDPRPAGLPVGHDALAGRQDGHAEPALDPGQLGALLVDPEARPADAAEPRDDALLALPVPEGDPDHLGAGLLDLVVRDEPLGLQDLRDLELDARDRHHDLGAPGHEGVPDAGQHVGDRIRDHTHYGHLTSWP